MVADSHCENRIILDSWVSVYQEVVQLEVFLYFGHGCREGVYLEPCSQGPEHLGNLDAGGAKEEFSLLQSQPLVHRNHRLFWTGRVDQNIVQSVFHILRVDVEDDMESGSFQIHIHHTHPVSLGCKGSGQVGSDGTLARASFERVNSHSSSHY